MILARHRPWAWKQSLASMILGAALAFLSTYGLTQCSAMLAAPPSVFEERIARHVAFMKWRDSR